MFKLGVIFMASVYNLLLKICGLIYRTNGANFSTNRSQNELQSGVIAKCQVMCGENVSGFIEEPKTVKFVVQEIFVGNDHNLGSEISGKNLTGLFDEELDSCSFHFDLLNGFCPINQDSQELVSKVDDIDQERGEEDLHFKIDQEKEEILEGKGSLNFSEVELLPTINSSDVANQEFDTSGNDVLTRDDSENWMSDFLDQTDRENREGFREFDHDSLEKVEDLDDEYIVSRVDDIDQERGEEDLHFKIDQEKEEILEGKESLNFSEDGILDEQDFSYEVELLPTINSSDVANQKFDTSGNDVLIRDDSENWMSDFLDQIDQENREGFREFDHDSLEKVEDLDDEYIVSRVDDIDQERGEEDLHFKIDQEKEEILEGKESLNFSEDGILDEQDFSYEVELLPTINSSHVANQESDASTNDVLIRDDSENWMSDFRDQTDQENREGFRGFDHDSSQKVEDLDDEYIELENLSFELGHVNKESTSSHDSNKVEDSQEQNLVPKATTTFQESDEDEDEADVLSEHQNLVQQMKMELKACRVKGLPTISEDCESPKMLEDLKPLEIDHKVEYKDIMEEIQKFYKSFSEKMRKLDILSYQTLHAISFLHLKDSEVFTAGKKKADLVTSVLPKIWQRKVQRIYADPMHKSISEMYRDLELVYVGQLCLSWEILSWLYVKARVLLDYDCDGNDHSYNQAAGEFQQFQVLMQRFMEDEPFQEHRNQGYVRTRCMIRSLLQVPIIRDDCLSIKKERREKSDAVSLEMLVEIISESMLIFREFLFADKKSTYVATKIDLQDLGNSELLSKIISNLQKKERRTRDNIRSRNCIVKKLKGQHEWRLDREILTCQVELRLVARVLNMSRLTADQLVWCSKKLDNISFVGRKVHIEPSFLLFPC